MVSSLILGDLSIIDAGLVGSASSKSSISSSSFPLADLKLCELGAKGTLMPLTLKSLSDFGLVGTSLFLKLLRDCY